MTSRQMPSRWTVCTTGYTAPWRCGEQAASAASSRVNGTYSSARNAGVPGAGWRPAQRQHLGGLRRGLAHPHALAVVAAADRFQHHRPGTTGELLDVGEAGHRREARAGDAEPGQPLPHHQLVLGQPQRRGAWPDGHARLLERGQVIAGHMLVVEGEHVASGRERAQVIERAVVAYLRCGPDLGGAVVGRVGQDAEADTEADSGLGGHPGQLAGAYHAHHGSARRQGTRRGIGHGPYPNRPAARR